MWGFLFVFLAVQHPKPFSAISDLVKKLQCVFWLKFLSLLGIYF